MFREVFGLSNWNDVERVHGMAARALAAFERTATFNRFSSKFDRFARGERSVFTQEEKAGYRLFKGKGKCVNCHPAHIADDGTPPLLTDFSYRNIGVPKNPDNPFYAMPPPFNHAGADFVDLGLGAVIGEPSQLGKLKVPTLRNVALTAPYMHNGVFATLREAVEFHNTRDVGSWPPAEVPVNGSLDANQTFGITPEGRMMIPGPGPGGGDVRELGNLQLTESEIDALVTFLLTLSDGYQP
jgi:cytochrome c peroxidase